MSGVEEKRLAQSVSVSIGKDWKFMPVGLKKDSQRLWVS